MKRSLFGVALLGVWVMPFTSPQLYAQSVTLSGKWYILPNGRSAITLLTLSQSGDSVTGRWAPAKGDASEIENGKIAGDTLTFSFIQDKKHFDATAHVTRGAMSVELTGPKKWGKPETIRGQAARADD